MQHRRVVGALALIVFASACGQDSTEPVPDTGVRYFKIALSPRSVTLSTKGTASNQFQLVVVPQNDLGEPLPVGDATPVFSVVDRDTSVLISPSGMITANSPSPGVKVVAAMTLAGVTRRDTVLVTVNDGVPTQQLARLSIQPPAEGDFIGSCGAPFPYQVPPVVALDEHDAPINNVAVVYTSSDPSLVKIDPFTGTLVPVCANGRLTGTVTITASATVYGVTKTDTIQFVLQNPPSALIYIEARTSTKTGKPEVGFNPKDVIIGEMGVVVWAYWLPPYGPPTDIVFDNPSAVAATESPMCPSIVVAVFFCANGPETIPSSGGGNIELLTPNQDLFPYFIEYWETNGRIRRFPTAGVYRFRSTRFPDATGTITVRSTTAER